MTDYTNARTSAPVKGWSKWPIFLVGALFPFGYAPGSFAADLVWSSIMTMGSTRMYPAVAPCNGKAYIIRGGAGDIEYDPVTNSYSVVSGIADTRVQMSAVELGGKIYLVGGSDTGMPLSQLNLNASFEPSSGTYTSLAPMATARMYPAVAAVNGKIYAIGGGLGFAGFPYTVNEEYDPGSDTWTFKALKPNATEAPGVAVLNGKIYVIGGYAGGTLNLNQVYDPVANSWTTKAPMPTYRWGLTLQVLNGRIYAIGGANGLLASPTASNVVEEYDPVSDSWTNITGMLSAREGAGSCTIGDTIYAFGGRSSPSTYLSSAEKSRLTRISWSQKASLPEELQSMGVASLNGMVYVAGGWNGSAYVSNLRVYSPATDIWTELAPMPTPRAWLGLAAVGCKLYAYGGTNSVSSYIDTIEVYDTLTGSWSNAGRSLAPMSVIRPVVIQNRVWMAGCMGIGGGIFSKAQRWDPLNNAWASTAASLPTLRTLLAAAPLGTDIYFLGGQYSSAYNRNEVLDTKTAVFTTKAPMPYAYSMLAAATVGGTIFTSGGTYYLPAPYLGVTNYVGSYYPATNTWVRETRLPLPRFSHGMVSAGGKLYVVGGVCPANMVRYELFEGTIPGYTMPTVGGLTASTALSSTVLSVGRWITMDITVMNTGFGDVDAVFAEPCILSSTLLVVPIGPLSPHNLVNLAPGEATVFHWTLSISGSGPLALSVTASGNSAGYCVEDISGLTVATTAREAGLVSSFTLEPALSMLGQPLKAVLKLHNEGQVDLVGLSILLRVVSGGSFVELLDSPPSLTSLTLTATGSMSFSWTYNPVETGMLVLVAEVRATDGTYGYPHFVSHTAQARIEMPVAKGWPNPFIPEKAVRGTFKLKDLLPGSTVRIYTVSGVLVWEAAPGVLTQVEWNGRNKDGEKVIPGAYFWTVECERYKSRQRGTVLVRK